MAITTTKMPIPTIIAGEGLRRRNIVFVPPCGLDGVSELILLQAWAQAERGQAADHQCDNERFDLEAGDGALPGVPVFVELVLVDLQGGAQRVVELAEGPVGLAGF